MPRDPAALELRRSLPLGLVGHAGRDEVIEADAAERAALARRLRVPSVERLRAELHLRPEADGAVVARGRLEAAVTQECGVTLEPVEQTIDEPLALRLLPPGREPADGPDDLDEIETGPDGVAELGEAVAEQLALALDPFPRAPGAELPAEATEPAPEGEPDPAATPFAALAALRRRG